MKTEVHLSIQEKQPNAEYRVDPAYLHYLERHLENSWKELKVSYKGLGNTEYSTQLAFMIYRGGELGSLRMTKSSQIVELDRSAMTATENSAPYKKLCHYDDHSTEPKSVSLSAIYKFKD